MSKKKQLLRIEPEIKKHIKIEPKGVFWEYLSDGRLPITSAQFKLLSIGAAVLFGIIYFMLSKLVIFSAVMAFVGLAFPYLACGVPMVLNAKVNEAIEYKEFINILHSSLKASNSTTEAIKMVAESDDLSKQIKPIMEQTARDLSLGDDLPTALEKAKNRTDNNYFKTAMTIVKINHSIGSDETVGALKNIRKSMDSVIDNIQLFKDKVNGIITVKTFFLVIALTVPFILFTKLSEVTTLFWKLPYADALMALVIGFVLLGQWIMDKSAYKLIKEV